MNKLRNLLATALLMLPLAALGQRWLPVLVNTNGGIASPTNFWVANSNALQAFILTLNTNAAPYDVIYFVGNSNASLPNAFVLAFDQIELTTNGNIVTAKPILNVLSNGAVAVNFPTNFVFSNFFGLTLVIDSNVNSAGIAYAVDTNQVPTRFDLAASLSGLGTRFYLYGSSNTYPSFTNAVEPTNDTYFSLATPSTGPPVTNSVVISSNAQYFWAAVSTQQVTKVLSGSAIAEVNAIEDTAGSLSFHAEFWLYDGTNMVKIGTSIDQPVNSALRRHNFFGYVGYTNLAVPCRLVLRLKSAEVSGTPTIQIVTEGIYAGHVGITEPAAVAVPALALDSNAVNIASNIAKIRFWGYQMMSNPSAGIVDVVITGDGGGGGGISTLNGSGTNTTLRAPTIYAGVWAGTNTPSATFKVRAADDSTDFIFSSAGSETAESIARWGSVTSILEALNGTASNLTLPMRFIGTYIGAWAPDVNAVQFSNCYGQAILELLTNQTHIYKEFKLSHSNLTTGRLLSLDSSNIVVTDFPTNYYQTASANLAAWSGTATSGWATVGTVGTSNADLWTLIGQRFVANTNASVYGGLKLNYATVSRLAVIGSDGSVTSAPSGIIGQVWTYNGSTGGWSNSAGGLGGSATNAISIVGTNDATFSTATTNLVHTNGVGTLARGWGGSGYARVAYDLNTDWLLTWLNSSNNATFNNITVYGTATFAGPGDTTYALNIAVSNTLSALNIIGTNAAFSGNLTQNGQSLQPSNANLTAWAGTPTNQWMPTNLLALLQPASGNLSNWSGANTNQWMPTNKLATLQPASGNLSNWSGTATNLWMPTNLLAVLQPASVNLSNWAGTSTNRWMTTNHLGTLQPASGNLSNWAGTSTNLWVTVDSLASYLDGVDDVQTYYSTLRMQALYDGENNGVGWALSNILTGELALRVLATGGGTSLFLDQGLNTTIGMFSGAIEVSGEVRAVGGVLASSLVVTNDIETTNRVVSSNVTVRSSLTMSNLTANRIAILNALKQLTNGSVSEVDLALTNAPTLHSPSIYTAFLYGTNISGSDFVIHAVDDSLDYNFFGSDSAIAQTVMTHGEATNLVAGATNLLNLNVKLGIVTNNVRYEVRTYTADLENGTNMVLDGMYKRTYYSVTGAVHFITLSNIAVTIGSGTAVYLENFSGANHLISWTNAWKMLSSSNGVAWPGSMTLSNGCVGVLSGEPRAADQTNVYAAIVAQPKP